MLQIGAPPPEAFAACTVRDAAGTPHALADVWAHRPTLLRFIRHFGCIGCSEGIERLRPALPELDRLGVQVVLIGCGAPHFIAGFLQQQRLLYSPVRCFTDETLTAHRIAGLAHGAWGGWGPRGLYEQARAFVGGHVAGPIQGDPHQQAGAVLLDAAGVVRLVHRSRSLGDHPSARALLGAAIAIVADAQPLAR